MLIVSRWCLLVFGLSVWCYGFDLVVWGFGLFVVMVCLHVVLMVYYNCRVCCLVLFFSCCVGWWLFDCLVGVLVVGCTVYYYVCYY